MSGNEWSDPNIQHYNVPLISQGTQEEVTLLELDLRQTLKVQGAFLKTKIRVLIK